ncbi:hypothetical protein CANARDRAFT_9156 [[Candida] arabinofermentans NRRL YB-2248]|uniref:Uncharacterized protein n=1 Tax=[Candida] arabinofermentans NRRL YB-2248 TaxID=983967 RepID=A0A1E4SWI5_9ASCO|nr:hypothetical protein CANARDRAFT_9156 [[Candida] arabinofermentans NRRL YB-2248]
MATATPNSRISKKESISKKQISSITASKRYTKDQKQKLIDRFTIQFQERERQFIELSEKQSREVNLKLKNRLNKILRKFWDFKINDILNYERENSVDDVNLITVLKALEEVKNGKISGFESDKENKGV